MDVDIDRMKSVVYPILSISSVRQNVPVFYRKKELDRVQRRKLGIEENAIVMGIYAEGERNISEE